ncbi:hypothetical protein ALC53_06744 [Atta colombica]|uniref:Uncharacterized protein n=1 Tax=Atta colombica TaxID=520822 RepID=A0A151I3L9_9HYME|nr:hypothetical protein ALC53_06744 [Atta colombica]
MLASVGLTCYSDITQMNSVKKNVFDHPTYLSINIAKLQRGVNQTVFAWKNKNTGSSDEG